jgi:hypothetical protein
MKWSGLVALALVGGSLIPVGAVAQRPLELRVTPRAGLLTPADWFYVEFVNFQLGPTEWTEAAILRSPIVGLAAELAAEPLGLWIRAEAMRTVGGRTAVIHAYMIPASQAGPARVIRTQIDVPTAITTGTVDLVLPTRLRLPGAIQPYVTAGLGAKRYDFDIRELEERPERFVVPRDGVVPMLNVGVGAVFQVRGVSFDLLVRDAVSEYWDGQQHDVMFLSGVTIRLR